MNRTSVARVLRAAMVACGVAALLLLLVDCGPLLLGYSGAGSGSAVLLPFVAVGVCAVGLGFVLPRVDAAVGRLTHHREVTPYSALAAAAARIRAGSLEQALPGLAQVLADGTGATRAVVWLAVGDRLVAAAEHPPRVSTGSDEEHVPNLAVLLARPGTDHVVPVLDGAELRAALAIGKPDAPITPADQRLVQDVANGAALLLRGVAQNAELAERVRRADDLATQLDDSRQRLSQAREVERRRLVMELAHATGDRLAALRAEVDRAHGALECRPEVAAAAHEALVRARGGLDELLDRFRVIARGVYPAVLRDQGPAAALDEVATDLPRPVRLTGSLGGRLDWEIESGLYYVTAAALHALAGRPAEGELVVAFGRADGRATVRIDDAAPDVTPDRLRTALADDVERLVALGGDLELILPDGPERPLGMRAWVPDHLEPVVESGAGAELGVR
ncbi:hypothetical protein GCM10010464_84300 [Pseudonocardia yunnanensis]|uniref:Uncharacterized protein n=1 Tax=Pseudonocardia yunnanensis TaxID=58107 RepID=A0ABW4F5K6_9PSEU